MTHHQGGVCLKCRIKPTEARYRGIGTLRQWLNEDRITDPERMVTNEQLEHWLPDSPLAILERLKAEVEIEKNDNTIGYDFGSDGQVCYDDALDKVLSLLDTEIKKLTI